MCLKVKNFVLSIKLRKNETLELANLNCLWTDSYICMKNNVNLGLMIEILIFNDFIKFEFEIFRFKKLTFIDKVKSLIQKLFQIKK